MPDVPERNMIRPPRDDRGVRRRTATKIVLVRGALFALTLGWLAVEGLFGTVGFGIAADAVGLILTVVLAGINVTALILLFFRPLAAAILVAAGLVASIVFLVVRFTGGVAGIAVVLVVFAALVVLVGVLAHRARHQ